MKSRKLLAQICVIVALCIPMTGKSCAGLLMETNGIVSFAPYVNGIEKTEGLYPGYRAEFIATVDFYREGGLVLTGTVGNMTIISRSDSSVFTLDRVRYTLSPGFRYEFTDWLIRGSFNHESLYAISREEERDGAFWANSVRLDFGTKGSYAIHLRERYRTVSNRFLNALDANAGTGIFLHGSRSVWSAKNHTYRYEFYGTVRYHVGSFGSWVFFAGCNEHVWVKKDRSTENKIALSLNFLRKGVFSFFGIVYTYIPYDSYAENNEDGLGSVSLRVVF